MVRSSSQESFKFQGKKANKIVQSSKKGNMQTTLEVTEAHPISKSDENKLASPMGKGTSHLPVSQPSLGSRGPSFKPKAGGRSPSGKGFLKRKFPLWLKRKGPANSPQALAVPRSRLCAEATHESPIQAVRKPTQRETLSLHTEEDLRHEKTGPSFLKKLWCLKATNSKLKKPQGSEASPLQRARWGPVAALSRTADPHGESPLRWKPRVETQSPEDLSLLAEPEKVEIAPQVDALWFAKPWRTFRTMMAARAKKGSVFSENERNLGATRENVISRPAELETSPANKFTREQNVVALQNKMLPSTPLPMADELCESQEDEEANRTPQYQLESHRRMEAILKPVPKLPVHQDNDCHEDNPILEVISELQGIPTEVCYLPGGKKLEGQGISTEDEGLKQGDDRFWRELSVEEDLAELAENPGGQGMVMATRGWLHNEGLGGLKVEGKKAVSIRSHLSTQGIESEVDILADCPGEIKHTNEHVLGTSPNETSRAGYLLPAALLENGTSCVTSHHSSTTTLGEVGTCYPTFSSKGNLPGHSRELEQGDEGRQIPVPIRTAALPWGNSSSPGSSMGQQLLSPPQPHKAVLWVGPTGPEEKEKRLIYVAAVEIVEAAIDAAAEQLAKKKEQERAAQDVKADSLAGAATQQHGGLA